MCSNAISAIARLSSASPESAKKGLDGSNMLSGNKSET
jgi:hypothetical protein